MYNVILPNKDDKIKNYVGTIFNIFPFCWDILLGQFQTISQNFPNFVKTSTLGQAVKGACLLAADVRGRLIRNMLIIIVEQFSH